MSMIILTESAKTKIAEVLSEETPNSKIRLYVQGGGCAGFSYGFSIDDEVNEDDFEVSAGTTTMVVDSMSAQYLAGATVDFVEDLQGSRFSIRNPQATTTCGCGSSFGI